MRFVPLLLLAILLPACEVWPVVSSFEINQHSVLPLDYFTGEVSMSVGDIGQPICIFDCNEGRRAWDVSLYSATEVLGERSEMGEANSITFTFDGGEYNLRCPDMHSSLTGDDWMTCNLSERGASSPP